MDSPAIEAARQRSAEWQIALNFQLAKLRAERNKKVRELVKAVNAGRPLVELQKLTVGLP